MDNSTLLMLRDAAIASADSAYAYSKALAACDNRKHTTIKNVIGQTPSMPIQPRNKPCGCGSGTKAKRCCGKYPKRSEQKCE